jgi:hypothetical protein
MKWMKERKMNYYDRSFCISVTGGKSVLIPAGKMFAP